MTSRNIWPVTSLGMFFFFSVTMAFCAWQGQWFTASINELFKVIRRALRSEVSLENISQRGLLWAMGLGCLDDGQLPGWRRSETLSYCPFFNALLYILCFGGSLWHMLKCRCGNVRWFTLCSFICLHAKGRGNLRQVCSTTRNHWEQDYRQKAGV